QGHVERLPRRQGQGLLAVAAGGDAVALLGEVLRQRGADERLVVHDQDGRGLGLLGHVHSGADKQTRRQADKETKRVWPALLSHVIPGGRILLVSWSPGLLVSLSGLLP